MSNDLRQALQDLANSGADHAGPATLLAGRATNRVTALRRRRRVAISAATLAGMAAVGTGAAAAISYFSHDQVSTFPDRLLPSVEAPASLTGLLCGAEVGDLTASTTPLVLNTELAQSEGEPPALIGLEAASIIPMFLTNALTEDLTFTTTQGSGVTLVQDGRVVAVPVRTDAAPTTTTLAPDGDQVLLNDRVAACNDAEISAGDYQAYGSIEVTVPDGAYSGTYTVVGGPWNVIVPLPDGSLPNPAGLPETDPAATFPQCGAGIIATEQLRPFHLGLGAEAPVTTGAQESTPLDVIATNTTTDRLRGTAGTATLVVVRDGTVVGLVDPDASGVGTAVDVSPSEGVTIPTRLAYTRCTPPTSDTNWLPPGEYSIWGYQSFAVTERTPVAADGSLGAPVVVSEHLEAFNEVAQIVIDEGGQPVFPSGS